MIYIVMIAYLFKTLKTYNLSRRNKREKNVVLTLYMRLKLARINILVYFNDFFAVIRKEKSFVILTLLKKLLINFAFPCVVYADGILIELC